MVADCQVLSFEPLVVRNVITKSQEIAQADVTELRIVRVTAKDVDQFGATLRQRFEHLEFVYSNYAKRFYSRLLEQPFSRQCGSDGARGGRPHGKGFARHHHWHDRRHVCCCRPSKRVATLSEMPDPLVELAGFANDDSFKICFGGFWIVDKQSPLHAETRCRHFKEHSSAGKQADNVRGSVFLSSDSVDEFRKHSLRDVGP